MTDDRNMGSMSLYLLGNSTVQYVRNFIICGGSKCHNLGPAMI